MRTALSTIVVTLVLAANADAVEIWKDGDKSLDLGWWGQGWYQWVENGRANPDYASYDDLDDFIFRRSYFYLSGTVTTRRP